MQCTRLSRVERCLLAQWHGEAGLHTAMLPHSLQPGQRRVGLQPLAKGTRTIIADLVAF